MKHLKIAQELEDRVGEGRACWSLGNAHTALGKNEEAIQFASKHLEISKEVSTLKCLNIGTLDTTTFPFVPDGKRWLLGFPIFKHVIIRL